jgi:hypothetical protein
MNERKAGWARTPTIPAVRRDRVDWTEDCGLYIRGGPHYLTTREVLIRTRLLAWQNGGAVAFFA